MIYITKMQEYVDSNKNKTSGEINEYCMNKYGQFHKRYPAIFDKCLTKISNEDMQRLKDMLVRIDMIDQKKTTEYDESVKIGKILAKEYVDPLVKNLDKK